MTRVRIALPDTEAVREWVAVVGRDRHHDHYFLGMRPVGEWPIPAQRDSAARGAGESEE